MAGDVRPPAADEIEVSVFGPGYGESIAIHTGFGEWILVDSCVRPATGQPIALEYLESIGVNAADAVRLVVATHFHDDHVRGLAEVVRKCALARFCCSMALRSNEFNILTGVQGRQEEALSGVREFFEIQEELLRRGENGRRPEDVVSFAIANRSLWHRPIATDRFSASITALSPSDGSVERALVALAALLPERESLKRRIAAPSPNHTAVVLWVAIGNDVGILLGADLETTPEATTGWNAVVTDPHCPTAGTIYKVAHHGSQNAHHDEVWARMLRPRPFAIVCPYRRGRYTLPTDRDKLRLQGLAGAAFCTAPRRAASTRGRPNAVQRSIRETVQWIQDSPGPIGQVRLRRHSGTDWNVEVLEGACDLHAA